MRTLDTTELNDVSGGFFGLLSLFSCFRQPTYYTPAPAPAPTPAPVPCAPAPAPKDCAPAPRRRRGC